MLCILSAMAALVLPAAANLAPPISASRTIAVDGEHGKLPWFEGTYEELLKEAKEKNKIIFIDLWRTNCVWCSRLDKDTFSDESVVAEMKDILCFNINGETEAGRPLAERFKVEGFPTLVLLDPDGSLRDQIGGYLPPDKFKKEIQRVRKGDDTVSGLRRKVEANPGDVDARYAYAQKLAFVGDIDASGEQLAAIKKLDPDGKSVAMHAMAFEDLMARINGKWMDMQSATKGKPMTLEQAKQVLDMTEPLAFLAKETHPEVLVEGWQRINFMQAYLGRLADGEGKSEDAKAYRLAALESLRNMWKHCTPANKADAVVAVCGRYWEEAKALKPAGKDLLPEEKAFALLIARDAASAAAGDAAVLDALAFCLSMNGEKDEAIKTVKRCLELEPENAKYKARLAELQS